MKWRGDFACAVEDDVRVAADWYEARQLGLGLQFVEEIISVWDELAKNPSLNCRRHPSMNIRWRYPKRFPYRVICEVNETERRVKVAAVLHAARNDLYWHQRI